MTSAELVAALHRAADDLDTQSPEMDRLARAVAEFLDGSEFWTHAPIGHDDSMEPLKLDGPSLAYGVMLGFLAAGDSG